MQGCHLELPAIWGGHGAPLGESPVWKRPMGPFRTTAASFTVKINLMPFIPMYLIYLMQAGQLDLRAI